MVIVLTALMVSCIFSILFSSLQIIFTIIILNSLSGRSVISSLFIRFDEFLLYSFICAVFICLFIIFFFLSCAPWGLLFQGFRVVLLLPFDFSLGGKCLSGGLCWFLLGVTCACVLVGGNQEGSYIFWDICTHTSTHTVIIKVFLRKVQELDLGSKGNQRWYQLVKIRVS